jgi:putative tricarboxylic transport membrane protein
MSNRTLTPLLLFAAAACVPAGERGGAECIAPAAAGGGWDMTCRTVARILFEEGAVARPVRVTNLPGAGGGIAFANVVGRRRGDPGVIIAASPATTLRLAQGQYGDLRPGDVRWLAALAADYGVLAVRADAPWHTLDELLDAWRAEPGSVVVGGGSAVGGQDHIKILILARSAGIDPRRTRYVPFDGGGEALTTLLGGFIQLYSGDVSEVLGHVEAGSIRVLAVLAPERLDGPLADVPTAAEQGHDVEWTTWRGFYVPPGLSDDAVASWLAAMDVVAASAGWAELRRRYALAPYVRTGPAFEAYVERQVRTFRELSAELGLVR